MNCHIDPLTPDRKLEKLFLVFGRSDKVAWLGKNLELVVREVRQ
jgi:hypothetical protein